MNVALGRRHGEEVGQDSDHFTSCAIVGSPYTHCLNMGTWKCSTRGCRGGCSSRCAWWPPSWRAATRPATATTTTSGPRVSSGRHIVSKGWRRRNGKMVVRVRVQKGEVMFLYTLSVLRSTTLVCVCCVPRTGYMKSLTSTTRTGIMFWVCTDNLSTFKRKCKRAMAILHPSFNQLMIAECAGPPATNG